MKTLHKILIANRGEIALRIMRTCRAMGIQTVAIYADPDCGAPFVRAADEAVYIGPPITGGSFLAIDKIVDAARRGGADAIHPGYGFLAENADFAQACIDAGIVFIGPSPAAIRCMGTKIEAKEIAKAAGVPTIPGFSAVGLSDAEIDRQAAAIGYPVLIKASAGGGGKGMRIIEDGASLPDALAAARREAKKAFGDDTLLIERYFASPRHIEIQILGDQHGNLVYCFERECSIQRRYQKIIEEAPSPALDAAKRRTMGEAATAVAGAIGYYNAGTVEFVADQDLNFYFLEVNTRLQVEHPVTEAITGLDLVRLQIEIAQGAKLPFRQDDLRLQGHAIEARIYAEDPANDFLPSTGTLVCWDPPAADGIRVDSGVETGSEVTIHYDPMLAKIISHGDSREVAARRLATALAQMRVHGVRTNRSLLIDVLRHPEFIAGRLDTHFLARHLPAAKHDTPSVTVTDRTHALAAALWQQAQRRAAAAVLTNIPSGWRNNPSRMQDVTYACGDATIEVLYRVHSRRLVDAVVDGSAHSAAIQACDGSNISLLIDDVQRIFQIVHRQDMVYVHSGLGSSDLRELPRFPAPAGEQVHGGCAAPMPGKILAVRAEAGQTVRKGETLVILEAMKMEHEVTAPHDGVVAEVRVAIGDQVEAGALLVVLEESTDSATPGS